MPDAIDPIDLRFFSTLAGSASLSAAAGTDPSRRSRRAAR